MNTQIYGCPYCSTQWSQVFHGVGQCPNVEAIEYYQDGSVRRVVFRREPRDAQPEQWHCGALGCPNPEKPA